MQNPNWQEAPQGMIHGVWPGGQGDAAQPVNAPGTASEAATPTQNPTWQGEGMPQNIQPGGQGGAVLPRVDVLETDAEFIYVFEVPGPDPDQINVEVSAREIALTGPESTVGTYRATRYHSLERPQGRYMRLLRTPPNVNTNDATARYRHGELELHLPKRT
ncbi:MAG TPA: Hsp20/alpha crystallin family protein [Spirochaetia bacterium]|nr:Hsp20/alpha crystallin family protein [Spirochaetia bacterium]